MAPWQEERAGRQRGGSAVNSPIAGGGGPAALPRPRCRLPMADDDVWT